LAAELGDAMPTGQGISVTQVEAPQSDTGYFQPDTSQFADKTFNFESPALDGSSGHATTVGSYLYGSSGVAPGAGTGGASINLWEANDWINNILNGMTKESSDVANFSWIGTTGNTYTDTLITRKLDSSINKYDYVAVVGVNNGSSATLPNLLCQSYNAISVGLTSGNHSSGYTTLDGVGRTKPDIVAPAQYTSYAAPMVAGAASLLLQTANSNSAYANAAHSQAIKAILMAGATKTEFPAWTHTQTQPLDSVYGAGELNIDRSYKILTAGRQNSSASQLVAATGWDYSQTAQSNSAKWYYFEVPENMTADEFSAVLTWNCSVNSSGTTTTLANLDLQIWTAADFAAETLLDQSVSTVDNVELLYLQDLAAGEYAMCLTSDTSNINYALAWFSSNIAAAPIVVPEPSSLLMLFSGLVFALSILPRLKRSLHN
jgi:hypothetical protein